MVNNHYIIHIISCCRNLFFIKINNGYKKINIPLLSILLLLVLSIFSAYFIEYGLGHKPCKLCIYQRYPYFISTFIILNILFIKKYIKFSLIILALVSLIGSIIAFYHFGIEQGFFTESIVCEVKNLNQNLSKDDVLNQLSKTILVAKLLLLGFLVCRLQQ